MLITCRHDKRDGNLGKQCRPSAPREILGYVESEPVRCGGKGVGCGNVGQSAIGVSCSAADTASASAAAPLVGLNAPYSLILSLIDQNG